MTAGKIHNKAFRAALGGIVAGLVALPAAHATDGYFSHGYGMKNKGMGGAATTVTHDAFGGANNPASMVWVGERFDVGIDWFSPRRNAERTGSAFGLDFSVDSDSKHFLIPEMGYNHMISPTLSLGLTVYGNGGMNTDYRGGQINCGAGPANGLCGNGRLGVDLMQLIVAPTLAWKLHERHSLGVSPLFGYQRFSAEGLHAFDNAPGFPPFTSSPGNVTNRGHDNASGWGVRVGYLGRLTDSLTVGAAYSSKINMSKFDKYKGLFANEGDFDIPANWSVGASFAFTPNLSLAVDYQQIRYEGVASVSNASNIPAPLGSSDGPGFGWRNIGVYKLGIQWQANSKLVLRAGYNRSDNPIRSRDVTFNILAPGVVKDHVTLGATWTLDGGSEVTLAYMHARRNSVSGTSMFDAIMGAPGAGGTEKIEMYQNSLGVAWGTRF